MTIHLTPADYGAVLPQIIVITGALLLLLIDVFVTRWKIGAATTAAMATIGLAFATSVHLWTVNQHGVFPRGLDAMVTGDRFAQFFNFSLLATAALVVLVIPAYLKRSDFDAGEFLSLMMFALAGMMLLSAALNLIVIFLAIELLSLSLYILSGFDRNHPRSQEAGFKYFLLSSFASAFLIYGMALIYGATGSTSLTRIASCIGPVPQFSGQIVHHVACHGAVTTSPFLLVGISLMLVGFAFKVGVIPFHMWAPDVYEGAPTPVTAFMSVATKAAVFPAFMRVFSMALGGVSDKWFGIFWALAIVTMIGGNLIALVQSNMKRLLAYSGIAHTGYILVAMASFNRLGATAVAFYFVVYVFMNIGAFLLVLILENRGEAGEEISSYRGLFTRSPWLASAVAVFMLSLAGIPPTAGFFTKYYALAAAVQSGHTELAIVGVLASVISLGYYLRVVVLMFMQPAEAAAKRFVPTWGANIAVAVSVVGVLIIGVIPYFYNLAASAVNSFFTFPT
jgi:NADH-quinone oxidoreductase subunit N